MRDIIIKPALNGYVVRLGCQRVVFNDRATMIRALNDYLDAPNETEDQYLLNSLNSKQFGFVGSKMAECGCKSTTIGYGLEQPYPNDSHDD